MKNAILALLIAFGLGVTFIGYASLSVAGPCEGQGNFADDRSDSTRP